MSSIQHSAHSNDIETDTAASFVVVLRLSSGPQLVKRESGKGQKRQMSNPSCTQAAVKEHN